MDLRDLLTEDMLEFCFEDFEEDDVDVDFEQLFLSAYQKEVEPVYNPPSHVLHLRSSRRLRPAPPSPSVQPVRVTMRVPAPARCLLGDPQRPRQTRRFWNRDGREFPRRHRKIQSTVLEYGKNGVRTGVKRVETTFLP